MGLLLDINWRSTAACGFVQEKEDGGERQMDSVGRVPEQEPCALFLVLEEKEGRELEEGVGEAATSFSSFPLRGTTSFPLSPPPPAALTSPSSS